MAIFQRQGEGQNTAQTQDPQGRSRVKSVLRYTMMPEILPRIRALGFHFGHFAYLLALIFASARLIPQNHPALNAANMGRFGVRQVIAIAANNIQWRRENVDQIAIFSAIIIGLIMIIIQAGLIAFAALVGFNPAQAAGGTSFFESTTNEDPILVLFANVFGELGGFWDVAGAPGTVAGAAPNSGNIVHDAVYAMLNISTVGTTFAPDVKEDSISSSLISIETFPQYDPLLENHPLSLSSHRTS